MNDLLIHDLAHKVIKAQVHGSTWLLVEPDHLRQVLDLVEDASHEEKETWDAHKDELGDLGLELSSTVMDLDTALAEKAVLKIAIGDIGYLISEGNIAAAQTLCEELIK